MSSPPFQYEFLTTEDGSPSVILWSEDSPREPMHNKKGAFSESLYIYAEAASKALNNSLPPRFFSLGLGLGYNELILCALLIKEDKINDPNLLIESYEKEDFLNKSFLEWLSNTYSPQSSSEWIDVYNRILELTSHHFLLDKEQIKEELLRLYKTKKWVPHGELSLQTPLHQKFSCLFFDAFSSNKSPELWSEDLLLYVLNQATLPQCILTTYAATGTLKRTLKSIGFQLKDKKGFAGKRECTLAEKT